LLRFPGGGGTGERADKEAVFAGGEWERVTVRAAECPRISARFLEEERKQLGEAWFRQEYECEFVDDGLGWFDREMVMRALEDVEPLRF
jgi:hypothetical protein